MDYTLSGSVFTTFDFVGFHRWPDAPREVDYLRNDHRHLFKVRVDVSVEHHNREIEFHTLKRQMFSELWLSNREVVDDTTELLLGATSCEQLALGIIDRLRLLYPDRPYYRVEVSEDGENGSIIEAQASSVEASPPTVKYPMNTAVPKDKHSAMCLAIGSGPGHEHCICYCHGNRPEDLETARLGGRYA